jgi:phosphoglycerate dehydrogenase-like enzyme
MGPTNGKRVGIIGAGRIGHAPLAGVNLIRLSEAN